MRSLFPLFLKLERRRCLVIGAGEIGEPKIASLLAAKGSVEVVAPHATKKVEEWAQGRKIHQKTTFQIRIVELPLEPLRVVEKNSSSRETARSALQRCGCPGIV